MSYVHRTMIVPAALTPLAQGLAPGLAGSAGDGMWTTGLSPTGAAPATHYVSAGMIEDTFVAVLTDANLMHQMASDAGSTVTLADCEALVSGSDVSEDEPFAAFARLSLQLTTTE